MEVTTRLMMPYGVNAENKPEFTDHEMEILRLMADDKPIKCIPKILGISRSKLGNEIKVIKEKLGIKDNQCIIPAAVLFGFFKGEYVPALDMDRYKSPMALWLEEKKKKAVDPPPSPKRIIRLRIWQRMGAKYREYAKRGKIIPRKHQSYDWNAIFEKLGPCPGPRSEWHIDHIRPLASFDLTDPEQLKMANAPENLQWLPRLDNVRKGAKYDRVDPS